MTELDLLQMLALCTFIAAPRMTSLLFLHRSRLYDVVHAIAIAVVIAGAALHVALTAAVWPVFCALGFVLHLRNEGARVFSALGIARALPFIFSLVSAIWFVAGSNDFHLLGYDPSWSYYAALHGGVLGWLVVGCCASMATRAHGRGLFLWGCYVSLPLFLCVAFGIDGVPHLKRVGAVGLAILIPLVIGRYALDVRGRSRISFCLALAGLAGILVSMSLALFNELWPGFPRILFGMPTMVIIHGCVNAIVVAPAFFLAIAFDRKGGEGGNRSE